MSTSKTFCPVLFKEISTNSQGDVRVCCHSTPRENIYRHNDQSVKIYEDNALELICSTDLYKEIIEKMKSGDKIDICKRCYSEEEIGKKSYRQKAIEKYGRHFPSFLSYEQVEYVDLRPGNTCNLACIGCNPVSSSKWVGEWNKYSNHQKIIDFSKLDLGHKWAKSFDVEKFFGRLTSLNTLYLTGGEPMLFSSHQNLIEFLIKSGKSKTLILKYNTNGTIYSKEIAELWKKFKQVQLNISIDGIGKLNEFIRFNSSWKECDSINKRYVTLSEEYSNILLEFHITVMAPNIHFLTEILDYLFSINSKYPRIYFNILNQPSYLNFSVLNQAEKDIAIRKIDSYLASCKLFYITENLYTIKRMLVSSSYIEDSRSNYLRYLGELKTNRGVTLSTF